MNRRLGSSQADLVAATEEAIYDLRTFSREHLLDDTRYLPPRRLGRALEIYLSMSDRDYST